MPGLGVLQRAKLERRLGRNVHRRVRRPQGQHRAPRESDHGEDGRGETDSRNRPENLPVDWRGNICVNRWIFGGLFVCCRTLRGKQLSRTFRVGKPNEILLPVENNVVLFEKGHPKDRAAALVVVDADAPPRGFAFPVEVGIWEPFDGCTVTELDEEAGQPRELQRRVRDGPTQVRQRRRPKRQAEGRLLAGIHQDALECSEGVGREVRERCARIDHHRAYIAGESQGNFLRIVGVLQRSDFLHVDRVRVAGGQRHPRHPASPYRVCLAVPLRQRVVQELAQARLLGVFF